MRKTQVANKNSRNIKEPAFIKNVERFEGNAKNCLEIKIGKISDGRSNEWIQRRAFPI